MLKMPQCSTVQYSAAEQREHDFVGSFAAWSFKLMTPVIGVVGAG
jgi:hypothetical protein